MKRNLSLTVTRKGRTQDTLDLFGDPDDVSALEKVLKGWLEGHGWSEGRWPEFELVARYAGEGKIRAKVRA